jgi:methylphosphotriester-DNA--protein-cysteine methyltransferase
MSCERVREALAGEGSVAEAIYDAGFNSSGRFYEASNAMLGMMPSRFQGHSDPLRDDLPDWLAPTNRGMSDDQAKP